MAKRVEEEKELISCLRNERIIVRHIPKPSAMVNNPKHILYGGMAETATREFVVPKLSSGNYVNVLTNDEKDFLENIMGFEPNALSIHKREHNFWDDSNPDGISSVILKKQDNFLDLSNPADYIRYKILLANKDFVAPSLEVLDKYPKATYQFVIIGDGEENKAAKANMSNTMLCYKEFGKIEENKDILLHVVETLDGRPIADNTKLEFLQTKINEYIQANPKEFLRVVTDKNLPTKVLIKKGINFGVVSKRGDYYYLREDNSPLCEVNTDPTLENAAIYLNNPKHQDIKFLIESKTK